MRPDVSEALRYLGIPTPTAELHRSAERMADELSAEVQPRHIYRVFELEHLPDRIRLKGAGVELTGSTARTMLARCDQAAVLACTLGARFDAKLLALQARDMAKAVIWVYGDRIFEKYGINRDKAGIYEIIRYLSGNCRDLIKRRFKIQKHFLPILSLAVELSRKSENIEQKARSFGHINRKAKKYGTKK